MSADSQNAVRTSVTLTRCRGLVDDGCGRGQINIFRMVKLTANQEIGFSRVARVPVAHVERDEPLRFDDDSESCLL
jgi:hypothetical protein